MILAEAWTSRNDHWLAEAQGKGHFRAKRTRPKTPLVLCGHGVSLRVERDSLFIQNGFTHYPQERETFRFFPGDLNMPPKIVMLEGSGSISFDVLSWLSRQQVPLVQIGWQGDVVSVIGGAAAMFDPAKISWQIETRANPERRIAFACDLISEKIDRSIQTMRAMFPKTEVRTAAIQIADMTINRLQRRAVRDVTDILMAEARAAGAYFSTWRTVRVRWKQAYRYPVPEHWKRPTTRRSDWARLRSTNRNATHPVNSFLNYCYRVLHSQMQIETACAGFDPKRGLMHQSRDDTEALILDFMEPRRPIVDAAVLAFVSDHVFSGADFVIRDDGVCRVVPQLARRLIQSVFETTTFPPLPSPQAAMLG